MWIWQTHVEILNRSSLISWLLRRYHRRELGCQHCSRQLTPYTLLQVWWSGHLEIKMAYLRVPTQQMPVQRGTGGNPQTDGTHVECLSYVDDATIMGPAAAVEAALQSLPAMLKPHGLYLQPSKSQIRAPAGLDLSAQPTLASIQRRPCKRTLTKRLENFRDLLPDNEPAVFVAQQLVLTILPSRVLRLFRGYPVKMTMELLESLYGALTPYHYCFVASLSPAYSAGGLGLPCPPTLAMIARAASLATLPTHARLL